MRRMVYGLMTLVLAGSAGATQTAAPLEPAAPQAAPASRPPPLPVRPSIISMPDWLRLPSGDDLARLYPREASRQRAGGHVRMRCIVKADGSLIDCAILEECPAGLGFGEATLKSAALFQMRPKTVNGAPVEGGVVVIPLTWQVAGGGPGPHSCSAAQPPAPSIAPPPGGVPDPAGASAPSSPAAALSQRAVSNPAWERQPTGDDLARAYPRAALKQNLGGRAVMECKIRKNGTLTDCAIVQEDPAGYGFGEATLATARYFRMTPTTADGRPVEGATVVVPIRWRIAP